MKQQGDKFNFFVPASFEKSGESGELFIKGIASSEAEDTDGEFLDPSGFDFRPLLETGYFNWNHQAQKSPGAILGRPTTARITKNNEFYVEGKLYKGLEDAQKLYQLATVLENEDPERRIGFSIEGQALERDPLNKKRVRRARITGIAITHCPKNPNTLLSIMKGEYSEPFIDVEEIMPFSSSLDLDKLTSEFHNWNENNAAPVSQDLVYNFLQNNYKDHCNDELVKNMYECITKSMSTANVPAPESVEGKPKSMVDDDVIRDINKHNLTKSQVYRYIYDNITEDPKIANQTYEFIKQVNTTMKTTNISEDTIKKAQEILALAVSSTTDIQKSSTSTELDESVNGGQIEEMIKSMLEKGMTQIQIEDSLKDDGVAVDETTTALVSKLCSEYSAGKDGGTITEHNVSKSEDVSDLIKSLTTSFEERLESFKQELLDSLSSVIVKSQESTTDLVKSQTELLSSQTDLLKSQFVQNKELLQKAETQISTIDTLEKSLQTASENIEILKNTPSAPKSIISSRPIERFENNLVKSQGARNSNFQKFNILKSEDRASLVDVLFAKAMDMKAAGQNIGILEKAIADLEISRSFPTDALGITRSMNIDVVVEE